MNPGKIHWKATIEEVDEFGRPIEKVEGGGLTGPVPTPAPPSVAALSSGPRVTVELPASFKKADIKDYEDLLGKMWTGDTTGDGIGFNPWTYMKYLHLCKLISVFQKDRFASDALGLAKL